jgi:hypothetical protein
VKKIPRAEAEERAMHYLRRVKIPEQAGKYPGQLSGDQQQSHPLSPQTTSEQKSELSRVCRRLFGFPRTGIVQEVGFDCTLAESGETPLLSGNYILDKSVSYERS